MSLHTNISVLNEHTKVLNVTKFLSYVKKSDERVISWNILLKYLQIILIKSNKSNQIKLNQIKSNQFKSYILMGG